MKDYPYIYARRHTLRTNKEMRKTKQASSDSFVTSNYYGSMISDVKIKKKKSTKSDKEENSGDNSSKNTQSKIACIGVGGCGSNIVSYIHALENTNDVVFHAINTDKRHLMTKVPDGINRLLIGKKLTHGLGTGDDPEKGKEAAEENKEDIKRILEGKEIIYLIAGLGKGTGGGASIEIAKMASEMGIIALGIFVCAAFDEGKLAQKNALTSLEELQGVVDTNTIILNDKLQKLDGTFEEVEQKQTSIPANSVLIMSEIINTVFERNIDLSDARRALGRGGRSVMIREEAKGINRVDDILSNIQQNSNITERSIRNAKSILVCIVAHSKSRVDNQELKKIKDGIKRCLGRVPKIYLPGVNFDETLHKEAIRVLIVATSFADDNDSLAQLKQSYKEEQEEYF